MKPFFLFIVVFFLLWSTAGEAAEVIKSTIKNQKFIPQEFHMKADTAVIFQITNEDSVPVEFESTDLNKEKMIHPGKTIDIPLKGLKPGIYEFYSDFGPKNLRGKIIVE